MNVVRRRSGPMTLRWLLFLGALASLLAGLAVPGASFLLLCLAIGFGGGALLSVTAGRRQTDHGRGRPARSTHAAETTRERVYERDERWDRVLGPSRVDAEQSPFPRTDRAAGDVQVEVAEDVSDIRARFHPDVAAMPDAPRESRRDGGDAERLEPIEEIAPRSQNVPERLESALGEMRDAVLDLRDTVVSQGLRAEGDHGSPVAVGTEHLEAAIGRLSDIVASLGTLAEIEVTVELSTRTLQSAIASLSGRVDDLPGALTVQVGPALESLEATLTRFRAGVEPKLEYLCLQVQNGFAAAADENLGAQLLELRRGVEALPTRADTEALGDSTRALGTAVASVGNHVRHLEAAVHTTSQQHGSLAQDLSALKEDVALLAARIPARPKPVHLEEAQMQALIEAAAARPRARPVAKEATRSKARPGPTAPKEPATSAATTSGAGKAVRSRPIAKGGTRPRTD